MQKSVIASSFDNLILAKPHKSLGATLAWALRGAFDKHCQLLPAAVSWTETQTRSPIDSRNHPKVNLGGPPMEFQDEFQKQTNSPNGRFVTHSIHVSYGGGSICPKAGHTVY